MPIFASVIYVTRAIIVQNASVLAAQRPETMSLPLKWELPGGKPEPGEDLETCLLREAFEELRIHIRVTEELHAFDREFRGRHYRIQPFRCEIVGGALRVMEHKQAIWQPISQLMELDWGPAESKILKAWQESLPVSAFSPELSPRPLR